MHLNLLSEPQPRTYSTLHVTAEKDNFSTIRIHNLWFMELSNCYDFEFLIIHVNLRLKNRFLFHLKQISFVTLRKNVIFLKFEKKKLDVEKMIMISICLTSCLTKSLFLDVLLNCACSRSCAVLAWPTSYIGAT